MRVLSAIICAAVLIFAATRIKFTNLDLARTIGLMAFLAFAEAFRIKFPWGRPMRLGVAVMLCIVAIRPLPEVLWIFFIGSMGGRLVTKMQRISKGDFYHIIQRTYLVGLAGLFYHLIINLGGNRVEWRLYLPTYTTQYPYYNPAITQRALIFPLAFLAMALIYYLGEMITSALETGAARSGNWRTLLPHQMRKTFPVYAALSASGFLMALYFPRIPWLSFVLFLIPLFLVMAESNTDKRLDDRLLQTMQAVSGVAELGWGDDGHSARVASLSLDVAREIGISEDEIHDLRFAAALHDIGKVEGANAPDYRSKGAGLLRGIPGLEGVANVLYAEQREVDEGPDRNIPMASRIVNVVCTYDHLAQEEGAGADATAIVNEMSMERGKLYDSVVLRALAAVLSRRREARHGRPPLRERRERAKVFEEDLDTSFEEIWKDEEQ